MKKLLFILFLGLVVLKFCSCSYGKESIQSYFVIYTLTRIDTTWRDLEGEKVWITWEAKQEATKIIPVPYKHNYRVGMQMRSLR